jgi:hypothetical protein
MALINDFPDKAASRLDGSKMRRERVTATRPLTKNAKRDAKSKHGSIYSSPSFAMPMTGFIVLAFGKSAAAPPAVTIIVRRGDWERLPELFSGWERRSPTRRVTKTPATRRIRRSALQGAALFRKLILALALSGPQSTRSARARRQ